MAEVKHRSLDEAVKYITTKLAFRNLNFEGKSKEEFYSDQNNLKRIMNEVQKNEQEVKNGISAIYNTIVHENPGIELPSGVMLEIANYVSLQVDEQKMTSPTQIATSSEFANEVLKNIIPYRSDSGEKNGSSVAEVVAAIYITKEGLEKFQEEMKENYGHNYFVGADFNKVKEANEEVIKVIGKENLESILEKANNGDLEAARTLMIIQNAQIKIGYNSNVEQIPEDRMQDYLKDMILLSQSVDSSEVQAIFDKMAEKLPEEAFETGKDGTKTVSVDRLKEMYKARNDGKDIDIEFCEKTYTELAKQYIENEENHFKNGVEDFTIENTIEGQQRMLNRNYEICLEQADKSPENYEYAIADLKENSKKYLDASLRLAEAISQRGIDPAESKVFGALNDAVLDGLISAKNGTEFVDDEYTKASKKSLFTSIVNINMDSKEPVNQDLLRKMVEADSEVMKDVLKCVLNKYNNTPSQITGEYYKTIEGLIRENSENVRVKNNAQRASKVQEDNDEPSL